MTTIKRFLPYLIAVVASFIAAGIFIAAMDFNPFKAYETILFTSFRTPNGFIQTLLKWIPLTLVALAFTVPLSSGKFNIGAEGQMIVGAIGATAVGIIFTDLPAYLLLPMVIIAGVLAGALWGLIAAWLLYQFNINEILTTVLLNFISFALIDYIATGPWRDPAAGHPTTIPIGAGGFLPMLINNPPLHSGIFLALLVAIGIYFFTNKTTSGYELVATGANPRAAKVHGINIRKMFLFSMVIGAGVAGLAGVIEVSGVHHRLIEGLHSNFPVLGLIIGLIARGKNQAVPFVAFFIAILEVGASAMQRTLMIPVQIVLIMEALILVFILLSDLIRRRQK
ncbi:MAG: simple sugar transport system permease protein [Chloroflexi bacterium]|nr:MAG: simple sugar transport system permease protein [Chloroflexota bacterium]